MGSGIHHVHLALGELKVKSFRTYLMAAPEADVEFSPYYVVFMLLTDPLKVAKILGLMP